jgi:hypothetical protein
VISLFGHDPATYRPHSLHSSSRAYPENNCYADIIIELVHARGDEPLAALGATLRTDFEGDQFTFFKPPAADLEQLFGIDIHEMQPYRPLPDQAAEQLAAGRTIIVELDSFHLPDTASTSYRQDHVKSSVIVEAIDVTAERMHYFHNGGLYALAGEDFRGVFRLGRPYDDDVLPPFTELARFDAGPRLQGEDLRASARELLAMHASRRPETNPFTRFEVQLTDTLPELVAGDPADYHAYAFATVRMAGASFDLAASHIDWVFEQRHAAADAFRRITESSKTLSLKLARRKPFDPEPLVSTLADAWREGQERLDDALR